MKHYSREHRRRCRSVTVSKTNIAQHRKSPPIDPLTITGVAHTAAAIRVSAQQLLLLTPRDRVRDGLVVARAARRTLNYLIN